MRWVIGNDKNRTIQHREMRKWKEADRKGFMERLGKLEDQAAKEVLTRERQESPTTMQPLVEATGQSGPAVEKDKGTEWCLEMIEDILRGWGDDVRGVEEKGVGSESS